MARLKAIPFRPLIGAAVFLVLVFASLSHRSALYDYAAGTTDDVSNFQWKAEGEHQLARRIYPSELLSRNLTNDLHTIPKIFHQSWKTDKVPKKFQQWSQACRKTHPDWAWVLWSNDDNRDLVEKFFPHLLKVYDALKDEIYRADFARNLYMFLFGGTYADLDMECLRPSEVIFDEYHVSSVQYNATPAAPIASARNTRAAFLGRMGRDDNFDNSIPNAWMASTPGHPFWFLPLDYVVSKVNNSEDADDFRSMTAEALTGPEALRNMVARYRDDFQGGKAGELDAKVRESPMDGVYGSQMAGPHRLEILPHQIIYPYAWTNEDADKREFCWAHKDTYDRQKCKEALHLGLQGSVAVTYWTHSW